MNRREFLIAGGALAASGMALAADKKKRAEAAAAPEAPAGKLIASAPVLQNAAETSIGVSFAVSADASGWVDYATTPDLSGAKRAYSGEHGLMTVDDKVALIRLTGLKPATKYYYRIGADRISFKGGYEMKNLGPEADEKIHSFTTLGAAASGSFCVINDTHNQKPALKLAFEKLREIKPAAVVWNGDASNTSERIEQAIDIFLHTHPDHPEYASDTPYLFLNGNHDFRGRFNRRLGDLMMYRESSERTGEFGELGRNFVQRLGDIALIGLDTGEDKLDTNPHFAGLFKMQAYREKQTRWLKEVIAGDAVKTAKFKVVFCHIPLFDSNPRANPGDVAPDDTDFKRYDHDFAIWQRTCANLWSPYFEMAGVQLVIAAHQHEFRFDAPTVGRNWAQIVGGGPELGIRTKRLADGTRKTVTDDSKFPTVIEGRVEAGKLRVIVHDLFHKRIAFDKTFA